jgi:hypothetical protein
MEKRNRQILDAKQTECLTQSSPIADVIIYEISFQVLFYDGIEQEKEGSHPVDGTEIFDQLEMTGKEIAKMLNQFKGGVFYL